jgi:hypothetical protein
MGKLCRNTKVLGHLCGEEKVPGVGEGWMKSLIRHLLSSPTTASTPLAALTRVSPRVPPGYLYWHRYQPEDGWSQCSSSPHPSSLLRHPKVIPTSILQPGDKLLPVGSVIGAEVCLRRDMTSLKTVVVLPPPPFPLNSSP